MNFKLSIHFQQKGNFVYCVPIIMYFKCELNSQEYEIVLLKTFNFNDITTKNQNDVIKSWPSAYTK